MRRLFLNKFLSNLAAAKKASLANIAGVFFLSMIIVSFFRMALPLSFQGNDNSDYIAFYEPVAHSILNGRGFVLSDGSLAIRYPPGYPILLAGIFKVSQLLKLSEARVNGYFILFCMGIAAVIVYLLFQEVSGVIAGWLSALLFMTYPFILWLTKQPNSEMPFLIFFYGSVYLFWLGLNGKGHVRSFLFCAGILIGVAMLIRPIVIGAGVLLAVLFLILDKRHKLTYRLLFGAILLAGNVLAVLPWETWVFMNVRQPILLSTSSVPAIQDGLTFGVVSKNYRVDIPLPRDVIGLQNQLAEETPSLNSIADIANELKNRFSQQPLAVLKLFFIKAGRSWYATDTGQMENYTILIQAVYIFLIICSAFVLWRKKGMARDMFLLLGCLTMYFWLMTVAALSILRYMSPVIGLLLGIIPVAYFYGPQSFKNLSKADN